MLVGVVATLPEASSQNDLNLLLATVTEVLPFFTLARH